jgi:hypothetical protein
MEMVVVVLVVGAAVAAVLYPLLRPAPVTGDPLEPEADAPPPDDAALAAIESDIALYREAMARGTLCERCARANPPASRFCADCGRRLDTTPGSAAVDTPVTPAGAAAAE